MTGYVKMFTSLDEDVGDYEQVTFGDNSKGKVVGLGKVAITKDLSISSILHVDSLSFNLLSIAQICDLGLAPLVRVCCCDKQGVQEPYFQRVSTW
jgi:hypothetical protein